eukprot:2222133-Pyramimonas_sp.AAC.1
MDRAAVASVGQHRAVVVGVFVVGPVDLPVGVEENPPTQRGVWFGAAPFGCDDPPQVRAAMLLALVRSIESGTSWCARRA